MLNENEVRTNLSDEGKRMCKSIHIFREIDSTNKWLLSQLSTGGALSGDVCLAETQTSGRGRLNRKWSSPGNGNLYFSLLWGGPSNQFDLSACGLLSLGIGISIVSSLNRQGAVGLSVKWPNDILLNGKKICGILVENVNRHGMNHWVIGVGLNMMDAGPVENANFLPGTLIEGMPDCMEKRVMILSGLIQEIFSTCMRLKKGETEWLFPAWERHDFLRGKVVKISSFDNSTYYGEVCGISVDGALEVICNNVRRNFYSGDIKVKMS